MSDSGAAADHDDALPEEPEYAGGQRDRHTPAGGLSSGLRCRPTSHRQNDAELRVAADHARVAFGRFFEWICFDHGAHSGQFGEA